MERPRRISRRTNGLEFLKRFDAVVWIGMVSAFGCDGVEPTPALIPVAAASFHPDKAIEVAPGDAFELTVQTLSSDGTPLNGRDVYFSRDDDALLSFTDSEKVSGSLLRVTTASGTVDKVKSEGVAIAKLSVAASAPSGKTSVWCTVASILASDTAGAIPPLHKFDIVIKGAAGTAGTGGTAGTSGTSGTAGTSGTSGQSGNAGSAGSGGT